jgi:protein arginine kinase activator
MQYCTACQKAIATIVVMDLTEGAVSGSQHVCAPCAEQLGLTQPKQQKFSSEMLEDLLGGLTEAGKGAAPRPTSGDSCPGCGLPAQDFRKKGRLGCPRCYDAFRADLMPLLQRIHEAQAHVGRLPTTLGELAEEPDHGRDDGLSDLRRRLEDAVRGERYEEAAQLRDELRRAEQGEVR